MCNMDDHDLEDFVRKNKEKIEKILRESKEPEKQEQGAFEALGDAMKGIFSLLLDPKVQMHFIKAGKEFFTGIEEIVKNAPLPDEMRATVDKAVEFKDKVIDGLAGETGKPKDKDAKADKAEKDKPKDAGKDKNAGKDKKMKKINVD